MPRLSLGLGTQNVCKIKSGGAAPITTSKAFNSSNVQVGPTNTGDIPADWVKNETTVTSVIFANDNSVTSIGDYAFQFCTSLTSITIPNSVTSIGGYAFNSCSSLGTVTIGNSVLTIGSYAFAYATITTITIPNSVTSIGSYAFKTCPNLATATIGTGVTSIGSYAFAYTALTSINIPSNVANIESRAFAYCASLATVTCRVAQSAFTGSQAFYNTASPLVIQARITDASWTAGVGLTFQGNTNVTVIKTL